MSLTLRQVRRAKEIKQKEMAVMLGISANTYRAWERKPSKINIEMCYKICKVLSIEYDKSIFLP